MRRLLDLLIGRNQDLGLDRAALELARIEYPNLEIEPYIALLDSHAGELSRRLSGRPSGAAYVETANRYLFQELGFRGNEANYYDPRNSCLNEVLTTRMGIPITLAVVYLEISRRLGQPVYGIGMPGHFLAEFRGADFAAWIDVFHGGQVLTRDQCFDLASEASGAPLPPDPRMLTPVSDRQILVRMLRNLRGIYFQRQAWSKALQTLDLLLAADSGAAEEYKQRGLLHLRVRNAPAARRDLETYLQLAPAVSDRPEIEQRLRGLKTYQAGLN